MIRIVLSDIHIPFESKVAVNLALDAIRRLRPSGIDLLGDIGDCYSISRFLKNPARKLSFADEARQVAKFLKKVKGVAPRGCDIRFSEGNHEDRMRKYLWGTARELGNLSALTLHELYGIDKLGFRYYSYNQPYQIGQLWYHHGKIIRRWSGATAQASIQKAGGNIIVGHSHRLGHALHTTWTATHQGWENGCLCNLHPDWMHGPPDWQNGFSIVRYGDRRSFGVEQVQIRKGRYWLHGKEYKL